MDLGATKHMTSYKIAFDTYKVISPRNIRLGDDRGFEAIMMGSINMGVERRCKMTRIYKMNIFMFPNCTPTYS